MEQYKNPAVAGSYNVGPDECDCFETGALVDLFVKTWGGSASWKSQSDNGPHEANFLKLDCSIIKKTFGWKPQWNLETAIEKTVEWSKCLLQGGDIGDCMDRQIRQYLE